MTYTVTEETHSKTGEEVVCGKSYGEIIEGRIFWM